MPKQKFISRSQNIYNEFDPPANLEGFIEKFWEFTCIPQKGQVVTFHLIPAYTSLVVFIKFADSGASRLVVSGPNTKINPIRTSEQVQVTGVRFKPLAMQKLFGPLPEGIMNNFVELDSVCDKKESTQLLKSLIKAKDTQSVISHFCNFIYLKTKKLHEVDPNVQKMVDTIVSSSGNIKLNDLYALMPLSKRQLQRKFQEVTMLSPKEFCQILRFHEANENLIRSNYNHFDVLVESGYYDQSHYYKEFKKIIGFYPKDYEVRQKSISLNPSKSPNKSK